MSEPTDPIGWMRRRFGIDRQPGEPPPAPIDPIGDARVFMGIDPPGANVAAPVPLPTPTVPAPVAVPNGPQPGQQVGGGTAGNPPGIAFNGNFPVAQTVLPQGAAANTSPQGPPLPNLNLAGMAGLMNPGPMNLAPLTGHLMQSAMTQGMNDAHAGTPLQITNGRRQETFYPGGAQYGQDQYGDLRSFNPLRFIEQASEAIQRQHQGNMGIPLDQANQMAARDISGLYQGVVPEFMRYQLGAGDLGIRGAQAFGTRGQPGSIANAAQENHARFSTEGQYNQFWTQQVNQLLTSGQAGSPAQAAEMMDRLNFRRPNFITNPTGTPGAGGGQAGSEVNNTASPGASAPIAQRIQDALQQALRVYPQQPGQNNVNNRAVDPTQRDLTHRAINNYFGQFTDPTELAQHYNDIVGGIAGSPLGEGSLQNWYQQPIAGWEWRRNPEMQRHFRNREALRTLLNHRVQESMMGIPGQTSDRINPGSLGSWAPTDLLPLRRP